MSKRQDEARHSIEAASRALSGLRRESGSEEEVPHGDAAAAAGLRAALDAARRALEQKAGELEAAKLRVRELERERGELIARSESARPDPALAERLQRAEAEAMKVKQAAAAEAAALNGRMSIQQAEMVRLNSLRRKAEQAAEQSEMTRREVEEALRLDLRKAHAALDRASVEAGAREARAQSDIQGLTRRLEAALSRTEQLSSEQNAERERWRAERIRLTATLQRSAAVHAALRRELGEMTVGPDARLDKATRRLAEAEQEMSKALAAHEARAEDLSRKLGEAEEELRKARAAHEARVQELTRQLDEVQAAVSSPLPLGAESAAALIARLRPAAVAAYERLRELSAIVPLSDAERSSLRRAASSVAGLSDAVMIVARYLDDGPPGEPGPLAPALTRAASDWEAALARKGCSLTVSLGEDPGQAVFDPADLRLVLDQMLRRAFEKLPARSALDLTARRQGGMVEVILEDDGPGPSPRDADSAFEPGSGPESLSLPLARRCLRRWGGEARLERSPRGGRRLVLAFRSA